MSGGRDDARDRWEVPDDAAVPPFPTAGDPVDGADRDGPEEDGDSDRAADLPGPTPERSPEDVIRTVLSALSGGDPAETGVRAVHRLAAPAYRERVGDSPAGFREHLTDPVRRGLVGHRESRRGRLRVDGTRAAERVVVVDDGGDAATYEFHLEEQAGGDRDGCWLVAGIDLDYVGVSPDFQHSPVVEFDGAQVKCEEGAPLRDVLLRASGVAPGATAQYANCNGKGLCGTCAVAVVEGEVGDRTTAERRRLRLPPHGDGDDGDYRLSCQARVHSDLVVAPHEELWDRHCTEYAREDPDDGTVLVTEGASRGKPAERGGDGLGLGDETRELLDDTRRVIDGEDDEN